MLQKTDIIKVTNRNNGSVSYKVPDLGVYRLFQAGEVKDITFEEIQKLSYIPGGQYIINNMLLIDNAEAVNSLIGNVEPEYYYSEEDVKKLLLTGTLDQLDDCLTFAPNGVIDLVKKYAVSLKINDIQKRQLIQDKTGMNVSKIIAINEETEKEKVVEKNERKSAPISTKNESSEQPTRKAAAPAYKVISQ